MCCQSGTPEPSSGYEKKVKFNSVRKKPTVQNQDILFCEKNNVYVLGNSKLQSIKDTRELRIGIGER